MEDKSESAGASRKRSAEDSPAKADAPVVSEAKKVAVAPNNPFLSAAPPAFSFSPALFSFSLPTPFSTSAAPAATPAADSVTVPGGLGSGATMPSTMPFVFSFPTPVTQQPIKKAPAAGDDEDGEEEGGDDDQVYGSVAGEGDPTAGGPALILPEKPKMAESHTTGEEEDVTMFKKRCKVYMLEKTKEQPAGSWKERGTGILKINKMQSGRLRVLMRVEGIHRLVLNSLLYPDMPVIRVNEKSVSIACFTDDAKPVLASYLIRVGQRADADELEKELNHLKKESAASGAETKTTEAAASAKSPEKPSAAAESDKQSTEKAEAAAAPAAAASEEKKAE